jgi:gas vesicle protein
MISKFSMGLMLGIVVGILIAPSRGEESRQVLWEKVGQIKNKIRRHRKPVVKKLEVSVESGDSDYLH